MSRQFADVREQLVRPEGAYPPFRTLNDFLLDANWKAPNFGDIGKFNNRVLNNLIYYQTNYFVFGIAVFALVGINYPVDFLFGLAVVAALLMGFIYISTSDRSDNDAMDKIAGFLRSAKEDRPIIMIIAILGVSYFILSVLGKLFIFLLGIVLPIQLILLHAMFRTRNFANKLTNTIDKTGLRSTPMGIFLNALGLRQYPIPQ